MGCERVFGGLGTQGAHDVGIRGRRATAAQVGVAGRDKALVGGLADGMGGERSVRLTAPGPARRTC